MIRYCAGFEDTFLALCTISKTDVIFISQSITGLLKSTIRSSRNSVIVLFHWAMNAFGVLAVTQLSNPVRDFALIALSPLPTFFYILTAHYTDPNL